MRRPDVKGPGPVPLPANLRGGLDEPAMAGLTRPIKPHVVVTAATLVSVMNGWRAGGMRRVHEFGVSCVVRGVSGTIADSQILKFRTEMQPLVELGIRRIGFSGFARATERTQLIVEGWRRPEHMAGCVAKPGLGFGGESGRQ